MSETVFRVVRRRAKANCAHAYEAIIRAMFADARRFPGYISAELIPPESPYGEYQIIQRFATMADLARWSQSEASAIWHERFRPVAEGEPGYRLLTGLDAWFAPEIYHCSTACTMADDGRQLVGHLSHRCDSASFGRPNPGAPALSDKNGTIHRYGRPDDVLYRHASPHRLDEVVFTTVQQGGTRQKIRLASS